MNLYFWILCALCLIELALLLLAYVGARRRADKLGRALVQARQQLAIDQTALLQQKQLDTLKDEFISTVSHELRTPLTSIRGALGLLSSGVLGEVNEKAQNLLRIASQNTERLVRLINDILDLERMGSGRAPLLLRQCNLGELARQAADTMRSMAEAGGIEIDVEIDAAADAANFEGDSDRMQQVLVNLLSNAIKFSPSGSTVSVLGEFNDGSLLLRIRDAGRGVPADKLESIFDRFQQLEAGDSRQRGGSGLGLAIVRGIMTQHGGSISAQRNDIEDASQPGTTFVLRIPLLAAPSDVAAPPPVPRGSILVVDDDAMQRQIVVQQLRRHGYSVLETDRGEHAVELAARRHVEAILLDLHMPGLTGWQTLERLKANPATASIPVVILSVLGPGARAFDSQQFLTTSQARGQSPLQESPMLGELSRLLHSSAGPGRILLVEDDQDLARALIASFEREGEGSKPGGSVTIEHVTSAANARHSCEMAPPNILLLNLTLPDGSGFALVDWLGQQPYLRTLPMVVYSGQEVTVPEIDQLRLGPTQFLSRARIQPEDVEELVLAMTRHLQQMPLATGPV
jgi:signal transduction histidine kinase/CheY-like chemotaxis protein